MRRSDLVYPAPGEKTGAPGKPTDGHPLVPPSKNGMRIGESMRWIICCRVLRKRPRRKRRRSRGMAMSHRWWRGRCRCLQKGRGFRRSLISSPPTAMKPYRRRQTGTGSGECGAVVGGGAGTVDGAGAVSARGGVSVRSWAALFCRVAFPQWLDICYNNRVR
jgi:hypothetical protein